MKGGVNLEEYKELPRGLSELVFASLIGTGEMTFSSNGLQTMFYFESEKKKILKRYVYKYKLNEYVKINEKRNQCFIYIPSTYNPIYFRWYDENDRKKVNHKDINLYIVLLSFLLFGYKKLGYVEMRSTVNPYYSKSTAYYLEKLIGTYIDTSQYGFKIFESEKLFVLATQYFSIEEMNEFMSFMNKREKSKIADYLKRYEQRYFKREVDVL